MKRMIGEMKIIGWKGGNLKFLYWQLRKSLVQDKKLNKGPIYFSQQFQWRITGEEGMKNKKEDFNTLWMLMEKNNLVEKERT